MDTHVPGIISLQVMRDGLPQLVSTVPLRTGTAVVHALFCLLPARRFFVACLVTMGGATFQENELIKLKSACRWHFFFNAT